VAGGRKSLAEGRAGEARGEGVQFTVRPYRASSRWAPWTPEGSPIAIVYTHVSGALYSAVKLYFTISYHSMYVFSYSIKNSKECGHPDLTRYPRFSYTTSRLRLGYPFSGR